MDRLEAENGRGAVGRCHFLCPPRARHGGFGDPRGNPPGGVVLAPSSPAHRTGGGTLSANGCC